jgi:hypothetical protein
VVSALLCWTGRAVIGARGARHRTVELMQNRNHATLATRAGDNGQ